jgi:2-polyprenyl-3-methyl-5-hydroxy-6-metoxy-1,4-benzoquinol methylase
MYASFMGKRKILKLMLESPKSLLLNSWEKRLASWFGFLAFRMFGYPLEIRRRHMRVILSDFLKNTRPVSVLDVGCSIGYDCFALAMKKDWSVLGVDIDKTSIQLANRIKEILKCKNAEFRLVDVLDGSFEGKQFDVVILFEVLEHIQEDEKAIRKINKLLKTNGLLLIAVPYSERTETFADPKVAFKLKGEAKVEGEFVGGYHWREGYNEKTLTNLLKKEGFKLSELKHVCIPKIINKHNETAFAFPLLYPLSRLFRRFSKNKTNLVGKAIKVSDNRALLLCLPQ